MGRVQRNQEGADAVLRFVVTCDDATVRAVELRGREIRGVLDDGDRVAFLSPRHRATGCSVPASCGI